MYIRVLQHHAIANHVAILIRKTKIVTDLSLYTQLKRRKKKEKKQEKNNNNKTTTQPAKEQYMYRQ